MVSPETQTQSDQGDEIFRAFKEWLRIQEARNAGVTIPTNTALRIVVSKNFMSLPA